MPLENYTFVILKDKALKFGLFIYLFIYSVSIVFCYLAYNKNF